jgi:hypothetical protein
MIFLRLILLFIFISPACTIAQTDTSEDEQTLSEDEQTPDAPAPAMQEVVVLETNMINIVLNDEHRQGIDWEAIVSDFHSVQLKKEDNPIWAEKKYRVSVGTVSMEDYAVLLDALDTVGHMTQHPQAQKELANEEEQTLELNADDPMPTHIRIDAALDSESKDGPFLNLEPYIGVILKEAGKTSAVTLKAKTNLPIKDKTTIVIGGIFSEQEITRTRKLPLLGDLPVLGLVFRSHGRLMQKIETVVFITPKLKTVPVDEDK